MKKIFFLSICLLSFTAFAQAQCDSCPEQEEFTSEFCYKNTAISKACAQFSSASDIFYYTNAKGKSYSIDLGESSDINYLLDVARNKSLKIKSEDIVFLIEALKGWEKTSYENLIEKGKTIALDTEGYKILGSGLGIKVLKEGTGPQAAKGQKVEVHYRGMLEDGTEFDNSFKRGQPIAFPLGAGRVIKGWDEGISQLKVGSAAWLKIPSTLGYGSRGTGPIPANATLYFYVVLVDAK